MPGFKPESRDPMLLRLQAEVRLKTGLAPASRASTLSSDALAVLYSLASRPGSESEGLKLLHELQTHQVELDLQQEQIEANEHECVRLLTYYRSLFECAPVAYVVVDTDGNIAECNFAGSGIFRAGLDLLPGHPVSEFLAPESRQTFSAMLKSLRDGAARAICDITVDARQWQVTARMTPAGDAVLMVLSGSLAAAVA